MVFSLLNKTIASSISLVSPIAVVISTVYLAGGLGVARAFTALGIMALITEPLALLLASWPILRAGVACFDRIQAFLLLESHRDYRQFTEEIKLGTSHSDHVGVQRSPRHTITASRDLDLLPLQAKQRILGPTGQFLIEFQNACFKLRNGNTVLHNIDIQVPQCQLTMIIGGVGCGKSSLLKAILGEIPKASGGLYISTHSMAYCDQSPWLRNTSITENIIAESLMDDEWYARVVEACELHKDYASLPNAGMTRVGSGGVSLSGGQRQRVVNSILRFNW